MVKASPGSIYVWKWSVCLTLHVVASSWQMCFLLTGQRKVPLGFHFQRFHVHRFNQQSMQNVESIDTNTFSLSLFSKQKPVTVIRVQHHKESSGDWQLAALNPFTGWTRHLEHWCLHGGCCGRKMETYFPLWLCANVLGNVRLGLNCGLRDNNWTCHLFLQWEVGQGRQAEAKKMSPKKDPREVVQICTL